MKRRCTTIVYTQIQNPNNKFGSITSEKNNHHQQNIANDDEVINNNYNYNNNINNHNNFSNNNNNNGNINSDNNNNNINFDKSKDIDDDLRVYFVVGLIAILCYVNGIEGDFVHDDIPAITMNKDVIGLSSLTNVFKNDFWGTPMADVHSHKSYRPLTTITFRLNYLIFGLQSAWFHVTNILLHASACILFTRVCSTIAGFRKKFSIFAGILFAVHPIHTEAVNGIVGRADVLACIFFLVSLLVYHGQKDEPDNKAIWISIILGGLSMLAKETGITVFLLNLTYDVYRCWPALKRTIIELRWNEETNQFSRRISRVILSMGVLLAVRLALLQGSLPKFSQQDNPTAFHPNLYVRLLTFCYLAAFNWWLILCPSTLSHDWQMGSIPLITSIYDPRNFLTFITFSFAILLTYRGIMDFEHQRHVPIVLGFLLLVLPFLPATNLLVTVGFVVAERVLYIPSLGCVMLVVYGAQIMWENVPKLRRMIILMGIILLASGCFKTIIRNRDWHSRESLLRSGIKVLPHNAKMHYNYANYLRDSSESNDAINHYQEALELWPTYASAHNNLGTLMKDQSVAEYHFLEAIKYSKEHINAHFNLGQLYRKSNKTVDAKKMLERCLKLEPLFVPAYLELAKLYGGMKAGQLLEHVVQLNRKKVDLRIKYGDWLFENNILHEALRQYEAGLEIENSNQLSLIGACRTLRKLGQISKMHQLILRWQFIVRVEKGDVPIQPNMYLRDWSIKHELRNRAMIYDTGRVINDCTKTIVSKDSHSVQSDLNIRLIKSCNRSEYHSASMKSCKKFSATGSCTSSRSSCVTETSPSATDKRWPKTRHKGPPNLVPNGDSLAPLIVSNILDKL